jgi:hypothetical protein
MNKVLRVIGPDKQWPGIRGFKVEIEVTFKSIIPKKEPVKAEIFMSEEYFKIYMSIQGLLESDKIAEAQADLMITLIEDYAQAKYSEGYNEGEANANEMANSDY